MNALLTLSDHLKPDYVYTKVSKWASHSIHYICFAADKLSEAVCDVYGLSTLVRVATSVSYLIASFSRSLSKFTQAEFEALNTGTRIFSDPAYFLCKDGKEDLSKRRIFWFVGAVIATIADVGYFVVWMRDLGRAELFRVFEGLSQTKALRWLRVVSAARFLSLLSIGSYAFKGIQRIHDFYKNERPILAIVDACSWAAEIVLACAEMIPFCGPLIKSSLTVVAAGVGVVSYFIDISTKVPDKA